MEEEEKEWNSGMEDRKRMEDNENSTGTEEWTWNEECTKEWNGGRKRTEARDGQEEMEGKIMTPKEGNGRIKEGMGRRMKNKIRTNGGLDTEWMEKRTVERLE
ncbi:hypothetical protein JTB14_037297 [Gonioctena quinquepunctata]|nr:hypothetical protein JTB14_037297 [Gonioctena quinquepunctata]